MKHVLCVCYSQSGQLTNCVESLISPLRELDSVKIDMLVPAPEKDYPFPWSFLSFIDVFPESVLQIPPERIRDSYDAIKSTNYDLIIIGYQVWYLNPSPPVMWFLESELAGLIKDTPVVLVNACRNMWHNAWFVIKRRIKEAGGILSGHIVLIDQGPAYATFLTTPLWLMSGRKRVIKAFPPAGVSETDISALRNTGNEIRHHIENDTLQSLKINTHSETVPDVSRKYMLPEKIGLTLFWPWARLIYYAGKINYRLRYPLEFLFFASLVFTVLMIIPIAVLANIPARTLFKKWTSEYLEKLHNPFYIKSTGKETK